MGALGLIKVLLGLASHLARWAQQRQLISAGEASKVAEQLQETLDVVNKATAARRSVKHDADSLQDDPDRRD